MIKKYIFKGILIAILWLGGAICVPQSIVWADSSAWDASGKIVIHDSYQELEYSEFDDFWKSHMGLHARQECRDTYIPLSSDSFVNDCWFDSLFGVTTPYGNIVRPEGAIFAGLLGEFAEKRLIPTPKPGIFLELTPQDTGFSVRLRTLSATQLEVIQQDGEFIFYDFTLPPTVILEDATSNPVVIDDNTTALGIWYAKNGRYMLLANMEAGVVSRIDLETFQILTTAYILPEDEADRFATFDISTDGKFIVANILGREPRLINIASCANQEQAYISQPVFCAKRLLGDTIENFDPQTGGLGNFALFEDDTTIAFYTNVGQEKYSKFLLFAPGTWQSGNKYIALGDSFASGEGVGNYYKGTDRLNINMCHLSKSSYPFLLNSLLRLDAVNSVACSGAKIQNITGEEVVDDSLEREDRSNQYKERQLDVTLMEWTPGRLLQSEYVKENNPDIITVSVSGNDMNFGSVVEQCVNPLQKEQTCFVSRTERAKLVNNMTDQYERLVGVFKELQRSARLGARIYAIGYPSTVKVGGKCDLNVGANSDEVEFLDAYTTYANIVIRKAARRAGVTYVDMTTSLWGYRLCEGLPYAMNGLTLYRRPEKKFIHPHSYHPNQFGHALFAKHIREQTNTFTKPNPRPDITTVGPNYHDAINAGLFDSVDEALEGGYIYIYEQMTGYVLAPHLRVKATFMRSQYGTVPGAKYEHWLHSNPIFLGESIADAEGNIDAVITIPADAPVGMHTLKTIGKNIDGEDIEIWAGVYVAYSADDWDGNGVPNNQQICPIEIPGATIEQQKEWCIGDDENVENSGNDIKEILRNSERAQPLYGDRNDEVVALFERRALLKNNKTSDGYESQPHNEMNSEYYTKSIAWYSGVPILFILAFALIHLIRNRKHEAIL